MLAPLSELLRESRLKTIQEGVDHVIVGHRAVLKAVQAHNPEEAAKAMLKHLDMAEQDLRKLLSKPKNKK
jgi:DNA-binding FadR family transcriptional regulator